MPLKFIIVNDFWTWERNVLPLNQHHFSKVYKLKLVSVCSMFKCHQRLLGDQAKIYGNTYD